ncbi:MAG: PQQ-binding-like beta-propeller repeat protein [Pseudomonadota bacterium]|nr:PQQ-binding-like beta-propeller repeat protein [Pseudomonadota bacterium]
MAGPGNLALKISAGLIILLGLPMAWQGLQLALAGGTFYYTLTGLLMTVSAVQLWRATPSGIHLYASALLLTLAWTLYETGFDFWLAGSRIWLIGLIALWLCLPVIRRGIWGDDKPSLLSIRSVQLASIASAIVLGGMVLNLLSEPTQPISDATYGPPQNEGNWSAYGANHKGTRYAAHSQINRDNVTHLEPVWQTETDQVGRFSGTPLQIDDALYLCTAQNIVISLDADTGEQRWRFDPENETMPWGIFGNCRGVTYYHIPDRSKGEHCAERIYTATTDARMIALDAKSGKLCDEFGIDGQISLLAGMGEVKEFFYIVTSPPSVASDSLVVGGFVLDNQETEEPSGVVRAYDPRDGQLRWAWDIGREGITTQPLQGDHYTRGTPNVWSLTSADDELGLVYVPTGNATPDYFGGHRTDAMEKFASSVVAIDAKTGLTRWHFQTTHHDIWDLDVPSQPTLVDLSLNGERRKTLVMPTKRGELFLLDRITGEPITEVSERPVPQTDLAGEYTAPTQPFSTGMPAFAHPELDEADMFGFTPFDQMACRQTFLGLRYEGHMTPPSVGGTLLYPGPAGGMNWGSVAVDEERQLLVVNAMHMGFMIHMIPRDEVKPAPEGGLDFSFGIGGPQRGTPYAARVGMFASPIGIPCIKPPYGEIAVIDLTSQKTLWRRGMGPLGLGFPYAAGSIVTQGGLIFNAGVMDGQLRAIDVDTGEVIWQDELRSSSDATPMTYVSPATGRQYVLVTLPGESRPRPAADEDTPGASTLPAERLSGRVIAYALPQPADT